MPGPVAADGQEDPWTQGDPWSNSALGAPHGASPAAAPAEGAAPRGGGDVWSTYRRHGGAPGEGPCPPDAAGQREVTAVFGGWELDAGAAKWMRRLTEEQQGELLKGMRSFQPANPSAWIVSRAPRYVAPEDDRPPPLRGAVPSGLAPGPGVSGPEPRPPPQGAAPAPAAPRERTASPTARGQARAEAPPPPEGERWARFKDADQRFWWWCESAGSPALEGRDWFYEGSLAWRRSEDGDGRVCWRHEHSGRFFYDPASARAGGSAVRDAAGGPPAAAPRPEPAAAPGPWAAPAARCDAGVGPPAPDAAPCEPAQSPGGSERSPWEPCGAGGGPGVAQAPRGLHDSPGAMSHWDRERHRWLEVLETLRQRWQEFAPQDFQATAPQMPGEDAFGFCDRVAKALPPKHLSYLVGTVASPVGAGLRRQFQRLLGKPAHVLGKVEDNAPGAQLYFLSAALAAEPGRFALLHSDHWWPIQREAIALARDLAARENGRAPSGGAAGGGAAPPRDVSSIDKELQEIASERRRLDLREQALRHEREQALRR